MVNIQLKTFTPVGTAMIVDKARHPKCGGGTIGGDGEEQLVDFVGKIGAVAHRRNHTALGINADGNDNAAPSLRAIADAANDFPTRQAAVESEILLQPFRKHWPCASARDFDRGTAVGIAQTDKSKVEVQ